MKRQITLETADRRIKESVALLINGIWLVNFVVNPLTHENFHPWLFLSSADDSFYTVFEEGDNQYIEVVDNDKLLLVDNKGNIITASLLKIDSIA